MIYILLGIMIILIGLIILAKIRNKNNRKQDIFYNTAEYFYKHIKGKQKIKGGRHSVYKLIFEHPQVKRDLMALNPTINVEVLKANYYIEKIKLFIIILFLGDLLAITISVSSDSKNIIVQGEYIERNEYGEGDIQTELLVKRREGEDEKNIKINIRERGYKDEELDQMYDRLIADLEKIILNGNQSFERISKNMYLPDSVIGYPFELQWDSDQLWIIDANGIIQNSEELEQEITQEGQMVMLKCFFAYRDWEREYYIPIRIVSAQKDEQALWNQSLMKEIERLEKESEYESTFQLPTKVENEEIQWAEKNPQQGVFVLIIGGVVACIIFLIKDKDLHQKTIEKRKQMEGEYPLLVNRITLYLGAGMTIKNAWTKISLDYRKRKEQEGIVLHLYEEMLFTCYEMQSGIGEVEAYEKFAERCGSVLLTRLTTLLVQSLKKGNSLLLTELQKEAILAQEERRNCARKAGEEAGTKLLVPMMMMLTIVMIFILIPAFQSFGM